MSYDDMKRCMSKREWDGTIMLMMMRDNTSRSYLFAVVIFHTEHCRKYNDAEHVDYTNARGRNRIGGFMLSLLDYTHMPDERATTTCNARTRPRSGEQSRLVIFFFDCGQ